MRPITLLRTGTLLLFLFLSSCDKGLDPSNVSEPGFGGTITYAGPLPPPDSLRDLRIVAVPYYPIDTLFQPLIMKVLDGVIPFSADIRSSAVPGMTVPYTMFLKPKTYYYIAVVQQFGFDPFSQWKVVGVYTALPSDTIPQSLRIPDGTFVHDVNITVDFYNLPPQPFRVP
ncbi:MAG: hypothetical protein HUU02_05215 [Bacteroidetes bacterium]|nr:hypothetical protein [Bacteroidota bacterium]